MEFSGVALTDTFDITSNTKFTAHFNRPSAQRQSHTQNPCLRNKPSAALCRVGRRASSTKAASSLTTTPSRICRYPVRLLSSRCFGAEIDINRTVMFFCKSGFCEDRLNREAFRMSACVARS